MSLLDSLLAETRGEHGHILESLINLLGDLIESFESQSLPTSAASPAEVLRLLMDSNDLTQADLAQELGGQPVVSAILNGKRRINARQASELGVRFGVSPALFIGPMPVAPVEAPSSVRHASGSLFPMQVVEFTSGATRKATTAATFRGTRTKFMQAPMKKNTSLTTNKMIIPLH